MTGVECVEGMASGLYEELFAAVVSLINRYQRAAGHWGWEGGSPFSRGMEKVTDSCWKTGSSVKTLM